MLERDELTYIKNILKVSNQGGGLNFKLLDSIFTIFEHEPDRKEDIFDSYSENQFKAKSLLVNNLDKLDLLNKDTEVVIFGCWYGSILIPLLHDKVKKITAIDIDDQAITIGDNRLFDNHNKITWITGDAFEKYRDMFDTADIFINTSCEHMLPMNEWGVMNKERGMKYKNPWWTRVKPAHFAFTSNNMFDIPGHINCVNSIEEFKGQLPTEANVLVEDELEDERGTRYLLIGKL
jgi:SAM-dependent methyltransferase|tara:strand:- start:1706 stop:2410 length:705 start_codon:yes stop_codon:yes gene_type:complete